MPPRRPARALEEEQLFQRPAHVLKGLVGSMGCQHLRELD